MIPDNPSQEDVKELLEELNRCPDCDGRGYIVLGGGWSLDGPVPTEEMPCGFCRNETDLYWNSDPFYCKLLAGYLRTGGRHVST